MKYLVIGSGAREHAICYKLSLSPNVEKIYVWPANDGIGLENKCEIIKIERNFLVDFCLKERVDIVVIGPENYLVEGIVDELNKDGIKAFGPDKRSSVLESSKIFSKNLMKKYGVATADYFEAYSLDEALTKVKEMNEFPLVIKADGLAAGKGVKIAENYDEALEFLNSLFLEKIFGSSGEKVVIEKYLKGFEASIIVLCDGNSFLPLLSAKDHKQVFDGNMGPNTGGMGVVAPNPFLSEKDYQKFIENIMNPTLNALKSENLLYKGALFFGIMVTEKGPYLLEYNVRFGDPETQAILYSLETDFNDIIDATISGNLNKINLKWKKGFTCAVVLASKGYPAEFQKGFKILGLDEFKQNNKNNKNNENNESKIFFSAVKKDGDNFLTNGGRVLTIVNAADTLQSAREKVYKDIEKIYFENMHYRKDIGTIR